MADPSAVVSFGVLALVGVRLVSSARVGTSARGRATSMVVLRRIGWRHVWPVPLVLTVVLTGATLLMAVPGLSWGWWSALGGDGNALFGSSDVTAGTVWEWLVPVVFIALVLPALPLFALAEERLFRRGAQSWGPLRRAAMVLAFGMVHLAVGIPVGAALALSLGGAYFMAVYLRRFASTGSEVDAMYESATAHTVYNAAIIAVVLCAFVLLAVGV